MIQDRRVPEDLREIHALHRGSYGRNFVFQLIERIAASEAKVAALEDHTAAVSLTYGDLLRGYPAAVLDGVVSHEWDNKTPSEQRDWALGRLAALTEENAKLQSQLAALRTKYAYYENQELCVGLQGGCNGDLTAVPHNYDCPAQVKDKVINPDLYPSLHASPQDKESR